MNLGTRAGETHRFGSVGMMGWVAVIVAVKEGIGLGPILWLANLDTPFYCNLQANL